MTQKELLDHLKNNFKTFPVFLKHKRTRYHKEGSFEKNQAFCIEIFDNIYVYGSIINPDTKSKNSWHNHAVVICIFDCFTEGIDLETFKSVEKKALLPPSITQLTLFKVNMMIKLDYKVDFSISYGFTYTIERAAPKKSKKYYVNEEKKRLFFKREYMHVYAITTDYGVYSEIYRAIIRKYDKIYLANTQEYYDYTDFILNLK